MSDPILRYNSNSKRILIVTELFPNIYNSFLGNFIFSHLQELSKTYQITVFTTYVVPKKYFFNDKQRQVDKFGNISVNYIKYSRVWLELLGYLKIFSKQKVAFYRKRIFNRAIKKCIEKFPKKYFLLAHGHEVFIGDEVVNIAKKLNIPSLFTLHGIFDYHKETFGMENLSHSILNISKANKIFSVSNTALLSYKLNGLQRDDAVIIPNGVRVKRKNELPKKNEGTQKINILTIGHLVKAKNVSMSILAIDHLVNNGVKNIQLNIVGRGENTDDLKSLVKKRRLNEYIFFLGEKAPDQLEELYKHSDILLHPSTIESFSMVCLEAMSFGVAVISTKTIGLAEYIANNKQAILVNPNNQEAINSALFLLVTNKKLRQRLAELGRIKSLEFSIVKVTNETITQYKKLCSI